MCDNILKIRDQLENRDPLVFLAALVQKVIQDQKVQKDRKACKGPEENHDGLDKLVNQEFQDNPGKMDLWEKKEAVEPLELLVHKDFLEAEEHLD